jgi:hypothetical protein
MKEYVVHIEKTIATAHYLYAESAESAESIVFAYTLGEGCKQEIISHDFNENIEVTDVFLSGTTK